MRVLSTTHNAVAAARMARSLALRALHPPALLRDDYIDWLMLAVAGMQHPGNPYLLELAVRTAPEAPMLEIGSFCGLSASIIQYLKRKHARSVPLFCCDSWTFEGAERPLPLAAPVSHKDLRAHAMESFVRAMQRFSAEQLPYAIEARSDEFFLAWEAASTCTDLFGRGVALGGPLGFCFIDGNHSEAQVLRDFEGCDRHLLPGGLILFDDSSDDSDWEVRRVVRRVRASGRYEVLARNPNYLVRKLGGEGER
jgi:predicted O-methyltransferase YrrM